MSFSFHHANRLRMVKHVVKHVHLVRSCVVVVVLILEYDKEREMAAI